MTQLTLRGVSPEVGTRLRRAAKKSGRSLNKTALELLGKSLGVQADSTKRRSLTHLAGTWSKAEVAQFNRHTAMFTEVDEELWRP